MSPNVNVIIASINKLENIGMFRHSFDEYKHEITVVDEGDETIRRENNKILSGLNYRYYRPREEGGVV